MDDLEDYQSRPKPSKTPSWVMLGFILGALCVWALPRREPAPPAPVPATEIKPLPAPVEPRQSDIEALFSEWGRYADWTTDGLTYVCVWDTESRSFRNCFEVLRRGDALYFRTIERPRNLRAIEGIPPASPLEFLNHVPDPLTLHWDRMALPANQPPEQPVIVPTQPSREKPQVEINPPKP